MKRRAHNPQSTVHLRRVGAATIALGTALALTACGSSDGKDEAQDETPSVTQSPPPSATADAEDTAKKEAIAAYRAYWREMERLYADRTGKSAHLDQYASAAALKNAETDAKRAHDLGSIYTGSIALTDQTVTKVIPTGRVPNATISSCLDISNWRTVDAETKKPVPLPSNRLTKYLIVSTVEKFAEGWRVTSDEPQGKPC
ncbi:hypothetical protein [Streptomyces zaehneri]|uniref:hypothetical protein n=1 Tax=Streptomyces zaehneri TaxID=3051180 RepID=UPI0028D7F46B|nr:hypothetical protein [Streptomyces sp. DSM 40713]